MFVRYNKVIELMLSLAAERTDFESALNACQIEVDELRGAQAAVGELDPYVSCFVAMPFRDQRATEITRRSVPSSKTSPTSGVPSAPMTPWKGPGCGLT